MDDDVRLTQGEYQALLAAKELLYWLRACGVESWEGYSIASSLYASEEEAKNNG